MSMEDDNKLTQLMTQPNLTCDITNAAFQNNVDAVHGTHIIAIGAIVYYEDGTSQQLGPKQVDLTSGQSTVLMSACSPKCCKSVYGTITVRQDGNSAVKTVSDTKYPKDGTRCLLQASFVLGVIKKSGSTTKLDNNLFFE